jgi:acetyltransferase-like isoleucine patch superfamily enzyme
MYIKRTCLHETGPCDEANFGHGYGEECDFSLRASALGWKHAVAADVFVGPGVNIGKGAVVGARSTVIADVEEWKFVAGSPLIERGERPRFTRSSSHSAT